MVFFNIGDHRIPWQQIDEAAIAFVGFCDKPFALAIFGVAADVADHAANDDRWIEAFFSRARAIIEDVVVLPWEPATQMAF